MDRLIKEHGYQQSYLATILSKSKAYISDSMMLSRLPAEIRDECWQDPSIPKNRLLSFAKKKTEAEMLAACKKYREGKIGAQDGETPKVPTIFSDVNGTAKKIAAFDAKTLSAEERKNYIASLQNMRTIIDEALAATDGTTDAEADSGTGRVAAARTKEIAGRVPWAKTTSCPCFYGPGSISINTFMSLMP
ncbi:MAG: hypothetical protein PHN75_17580 [Syntrophales bacterium]|nr:hypothetical protein [Syntrophales bacterium]